MPSPLSPRLAIDRSSRGVAQIGRPAAAEIAAGRLGVRRSAVEQAFRRLRAALAPGGKLFVDGGDPLRVVPLGDGG